jgi:hypothetical protein
MREMNVTFSETVYDIFENWACVNVLVDGEEVGVWDDYNGLRIDNLPENYEGDKEDLADEINNWMDCNEHPEIDYSEKDAETQRYIIEKILEKHGEEWFIIVNGYETETSRGFSNTYGIEKAEEGDKSKFGWEKAQQLKDLDAEYWADEIIDHFIKNPDNGYNESDYTPY